MSSMTARRAALAWIALGCGDPSVHVTLEVPEPYASEVASVSLQVLVPPAGAPFSCDDVAFGEADAEQIRAARVQEVVVRERAPADLGGIPRKGTKLFYARAMDEADQVVVAACGSLGDIDDEDATVTLEGEPVTTVTLPEHALGAALPVEVPVVVTDVRGRGLEGATVRWTVVGPGGETIRGETTTGDSGAARIFPPSPARAGPAILDVRVRFEAAARAPLRAFQPAKILFRDTLPGAAADPSRTIATEVLYQVGRIGPQGEIGLAALGPPGDPGLERQIYVAYRDPSAPGGYRDIASAPVQNVHSLGLVRRGEQDVVVAMSPLRWLEVDPTSASIREKASPAAGRIAVRWTPGGPCADDQARTIALVAFTDGLGAFDATGATVASPFLGAMPATRLVAGGCASGHDGTPYRTLVFAESGLSQRLLALVGDTVREGTFPAAAIGIGFARAVGDAPPTMLGNVFNENGVAIARAALTPIGTQGLDVVTTDRDDSPTLALSTGGGDFDGDGLLDVAALLDFGNEEGRTQARILVSLGATWRGERIRAVTQPTELPNPRLLVADADADGDDDLVVISPGEFAILSL